MDEDEVKWAAIRQSELDYRARQYNRWLKQLPRLPDSPIAFYDEVTVDEYRRVTIGEWGGYLIQILSMGFNERIVMTPAAFRGVIDYGWCYDRGPTALMAALVWNPETEAEPAGFKKVAGMGGRTAGRKSGPLSDNAVQGLALILAMDFLDGTSEPVER